MLFTRWPSQDAPGGSFFNYQSPFICAWNWHKDYTDLCSGIHNMFHFGASLDLNLQHGPNQSLHELLPVSMIQLCPSVFHWTMMTFKKWIWSSHHSSTCSKLEMFTFSICFSVSTWACAVFVLKCISRNNLSDIFLCICSLKSFFQEWVPSPALIWMIWLLWISFVHIVIHYVWL